MSEYEVVVQNGEVDSLEMPKSFCSVIDWHSTPRTREESYSKYGRDIIITLKDIGYLDCYFSFRTGKDMILSTDKGKNYSALCKSEEFFKCLIKLDTDGRSKTEKDYKDLIEKLNDALNKISNPDVSV